MRGTITLEYHLSKAMELDYFGKYKEKDILESHAKYLISVTPETTGTLKLLSTEVIESLKDRKSKKEKKIEKVVERIEKERKRKNKARGKKIKAAKRKKK